MTKTLTEQWREGKLPRGHYYCKLYYNDFKPRIQECVKSRYDSKSCIPMSCGNKDEEVLSAVPRYDEYKELVTKCSQLQKKLTIATNALKEYANCKPTEWMSCVTADNALKEMEGVK